MKKNDFFSKKICLVGREGASSKNNLEFQSIKPHDNWHNSIVVYLPKTEIVLLPKYSNSNTVLKLQNN